MPLLARAALELSCAGAVDFGGQRYFAFSRLTTNAMQLASFVHCKPPACHPPVSPANSSARCALLSLGLLEHAQEHGGEHAQAAGLLQVQRGVAVGAGHVSDTQRVKRTRRRRTHMSILCTAAVPAGAQPMNSSTVVMTWVRYEPTRADFIAACQGISAPSATSVQLTTSKPASLAASSTSFRSRTSGSALPSATPSTTRTWSGLDGSYIGVFSHSYDANLAPGFSTCTRASRVSQARAPQRAPASE